MEEFIFYDRQPYNVAQIDRLNARNMVLDD